LVTTESLSNWISEIKPLGLQQVEYFIGGPFKGRKVLVGAVLNPDLVALELPVDRVQAVPLTDGLRKEGF